jgi:hypothetical protein
MVPRARLHGDPAQVGERLDARLAAEAAVTRVLDAAERHPRFVVHGRAVDAPGARIDAPSDVVARIH